MWGHCVGHLGHLGHFLGHLGSLGHICQDKVGCLIHQREESKERIMGYADTTKIRSAPPWIGWGAERRGNERRRVSEMTIGAYE